MDEEERIRVQSEWPREWGKGKCMDSRGQTEREVRDRETEKGRERELPRARNRENEGCPRDIRVS